MAFDSGEKIRKLQDEKNRQKLQPNTIEQQMAEGTLQRQKTAQALARIAQRNANKEAGGSGGGGSRENSGAILDKGHQEVHIVDDLKDMPEGCKYILSHRKASEEDRKAGVKEETIAQLDIVIPNGKEQTAHHIEHALGERIWPDKKAPAGYGQTEAVTEIHKHSGTSLEAGHYLCVRIEGEAKVLDLMNELKAAGKGPLLEYKRGEFHSGAVMDALIKIKSPAGGASRSVAGNEPPKKGGGLLGWLKPRQPQPPSS